MNRVFPSRDPTDNLRSTIDKAVQEVRRIGWCVLKDIIPAAETDHIRKRVLRVAAEVREGVGQTLGLINFEQSFAAYLADPRILRLAEAFFGPFVRISETAAVVNHPDNPRDTGTLTGPSTKASPFGFKPLTQTPCFISALSGA